MTTDRDALPCLHEDKDGVPGSAIMQVSAIRWECIVCGEQFRMVPDIAAEPAGLDVERLAMARAIIREYARLAREEGS